MKKERKIGKFLAGAAIGAGIGLLFAPKTGKETRKDLTEKIDELLSKAKEIDIDEIRENIEKKAEELKEELKDLDKEKALNIAKKKAKQIGEKANELVDYAKEKGTPALESLAEATRDKAIKVTKSVLDKLESKK